MSLTPDSVKRAVDSSGDDILTFATATDKQVQAVALVDDAGSQINEYGTNDVAEPSTTITYIGQQTAGGAWRVIKVDTSSGAAITYASVANNATVLTYAAAWAARATTLVYGTYAEAF